MNPRNRLEYIPSFLAALLATACTAPRSVLYSPEALPRGSWQTGAEMDVNLPTATAGAMYGGLEKGVDLLLERASGDGQVPITADSLNDLAKAMVAYSLDPIGAQPSLFLRYGIRSRFDAGIRTTGQAHALDARWQFLGPSATDSATGGASPWRGSLAVQYSWQDFEFPSVAGLDKLQSLLSYEFKRKDILVPLIFGKPFGEDGRFGGFSLGAAYAVSFIEYGSSVLKLVERQSDGGTKPFAPLSGEKTISSYGAFANARAGYRWIYVAGSLACYWQDYGSFGLFGGRTVALEGWTLLPALALEFRF